MRVVIINKSDSQGGAAVASLRLMHALCANGVDAHLLVVDRRTSDPRVVSVASPIADKAVFLAERAQIFLQNGFSRENLFKADTARFGRDLSSHPLVREADVVILAWINQGTLSLRSINRICALGKPVVWVMHDMWNCTGLCHHAYDCRRYKDKCGTCRYLRSRRRRDLSRFTLLRKKALYEAHRNLSFVAVSNWLAFRCRESYLMENARMDIIPNAFPVDDFLCDRLPDDAWGVRPGSKVLVMGAARLDDPVKGFDLLLKVTKHIAEHKPALASRLHLLLYGAIRNEALLSEIAIPYTFIGQVNGMEAINSIYRHADVVLSTSRYESLGYTLIEGQASGCVPVTFGNGGQPDIVDHLRTGFIADYLSPESFAEGIEWAIDAPIARNDLHEEVRGRFSANNVAQAFIDLFTRITKQEPLAPSKR